MMLAADRLAQGRTTLAMVAPTVGYNSESVRRSSTETCRQFWQGSRASRVSPDRHAWRKVRRGVLIDRLMQELREPQLGSALIAGHLAQTLLVEALRP
jgi:hypothetical protein